MNERLMNLCGKKGELLFVILDTSENVFGGYFSQSLEQKIDYYGTGDSFLFTVKVTSSLIDRKKVL